MRLVIREEETQRKLGQPAELSQRNFCALDAIGDDAKNQREERPSNSHPGLRDEAYENFRLVPRHIRKQAGKLRPSGDTLVCRFWYSSRQCACGRAHLRVDSGISKAVVSLKYRF